VLSTIVLVIGWGGWRLSDDATALIENLPQVAQKLRHAVETPPGKPTPSPIERVQQAANELEQAAQQAASEAAAGVRRHVHARPPARRNDDDHHHDDLPADGTVDAARRDARRRRARRLQRARLSLERNARRVLLPRPDARRPVRDAVPARLGHDLPDARWSSSPGRA
jgi:hypothetical protein